MYSLVAFTKNGRQIIDGFNNVKLSFIDEYTTNFLNIDELKDDLIGSKKIFDNDFSLSIVYQYEGEKYEPLIFRDKKYYTRLIKEEENATVLNTTFNIVKDNLKLIHKDRDILRYMISMNILPQSLIENLIKFYNHDAEAATRLKQNIFRYKYLRDFLYLIDQYHTDYIKHRSFNPDDQDNPETSPYEFITEEDYKNEHIK